MLALLKFVRQALVFYTRLEKMGQDTPAEWRKVLREVDQIQNLVDAHLSPSEDSSGEPEELVVEPVDDGWGSWGNSPLGAWDERKEIYEDE